MNTIYSIAMAILGVLVGASAFTMFLSSVGEVHQLTLLSAFNAVVMLITMVKLKE